MNMLNSPFPLSGGLLDDSEQRYLNDFLDGLITAPPVLAVAEPVKLEMAQTDLPTPITPTSEAPQPLVKKGPGRPKKRKRSESEDEKPKRDLLTEDEKRINHVVSEQRRRALIRDGFQALVSLTPALQTQPVNTGPGNTGGSHSKSTILFKAADYIKELQQQVDQLKSQLRMEKEKYKYPYQPSFVNVPPSFLAPDYYNVYSSENSPTAA
jgi:hypothetical protein